MKLEFGSGYAPTPGFVHVDANPRLPLYYHGLAAEQPCLSTIPHVDIRADASGPLTWADDSIDEIRAVDVLEHISYRRTDVVLREWARVLRPGGRIYVQVPDAGRVFDWAFGNPAHPELLVERIPPELPQTYWTGIVWRLLGGHADREHVHDDDDWRWNAHYALFDYTTLAVALRKAGLEIESCETNPHPNLCCWAVKP